MTPTQKSDTLLLKLTISLKSIQSPHSTRQPQLLPRRKCPLVALVNTTPSIHTLPLAVDNSARKGNEIQQALLNNGLLTSANIPIDRKIIKILGLTERYPDCNFLRRANTKNLLTYGKSLSRGIFVWLGRVLWPHSPVVDAGFTNQVGPKISCIALQIIANESCIKN